MSLEKLEKSRLFAAAGVIKWEEEEEEGIGEGGGGGGGGGGRGREERRRLLDYLSEGTDHQ